MNRRIRKARLSGNIYREAWLTDRHDLRAIKLYFIAIRNYLISGSPLDRYTRDLQGCNCSSMKIDPETYQRAVNAAIRLKTRPCKEDPSVA